jgi:hypothetical protein
VIAEKPIALNRADLDKIQTAASKAGTRVSTILPMRFSPLAIKQIVASGEIGEVINISSQKSYKAGGRAEWMKRRKTYGARRRELARWKIARVLCSDGEWRGGNAAHGLLPSGDGSKARRRPPKVDGRCVFKEPWMTRRTSVAALAAAVAFSGCRGSVELAELINMADARHESQLIHGFHPVEENSWRWTHSKFAIRARAPRGAGSSGAWLVLRYSIPEAVLAVHKEVTIRAVSEGVVLDPEICKSTGLQELRRAVPAEAFRMGDEATAEFTVEPFVKPSATDRRELGVIAHAAGFQRKK